jgi:nicotinamidase-related amidase
MPNRTRLDRNAAALAVIDIQERLTPVMWNFAPVEKYSRAMILAARELGLPVLATEQYPKGLGAMIPSIREALGHAPLVKMHFSCGCDEGFKKALAATGKKQVIVVGIESHVCVFQTVRDLLAQDYQVFVCGDAVTSRFEEHRRLAIEQMRDLGAVITSTETCIFDLLHVAGTPEFKKVSALVR